MFGVGIENNIRSKLHRFLQNGRSKDIVNDNLCACFVSNIADHLNVQHFKQRIGWRFKKHALCLGLHCLLPGLGVRAIHKVIGHAESWQDRRDDLEIRAEQGTGSDDMIAHLQLTGQRTKSGGHA